MTKVARLPGAHRDLMGLSSHQVMAAAGITYRQLDFWVRAGHVPGERLVARTGTGNPRVWSLAEQRFVVALARLTRAGINIRLASAALKALRVDGALPADPIRFNLGDVEVTLPGPNASTTAAAS